jgi:CRISPR-associated DxTHG motif protein
MKAISFLGTAPYKPTIYCYGAQEKETAYFAETLPYFFPDLEKVLVLLTPTAQQHNNWAEVQARLGVLVQPVPIPEGRTEAELWDIFNALTEAVGEGDTVIFDITHSFRSLPFLTFLAAAYLRAARQVAVHKIIYGAFDAKDAANRSPVFDLTPFVALLDWITATNQFLYTGNAGYLASQLQKQEQRSLDELATTVNEIALGLQLLRPTQVSEAACRLPEHLATVKQVLPPPFALLSDSLVSGYGQFGTNPDQDPHTKLAKQLAIINWYHQTSQIVHTLSLSREWLVSLLCVHFAVDVQDKNEREEMEILLAGGKFKDPETGQTSRVSKYLNHWNTVIEGKRLRKLWSNPPYQLANLRNDVLHSGFRKNPKPAQDIIDLTHEIVQELNEIAAQWGITHHASHITEAL